MDELARFKSEIRRLEKAHKERLWQDFLKSRENCRRSFRIAYRYRHLSKTQMERCRKLLKELRGYVWEG